MKCDEEGCAEMAMTSIRKDLFGKSDGMRNLCSKHAPPWSFFGSAARERDAAADRIRALEAALDKRKAELWKYGKHLASCPVWRSASNACDCGWVTVRSTLAPDKPSSADAFNAAMAPQTETASEPEVYKGMKEAPAWIDDGAGGLVNLGMALSKMETKGDAT